MSTATGLQPYRPDDGHEIAPATPARFSLPELQSMARAVAASRLFPGIENEQSAFTLMLLCESEGLHPMQACRRYHIVKGRPTMRADAMQAEYQRQGGRIRWDASGDDSCEATFLHPVHAPDPGVSVRFTIEDAKRAGLMANSNWKTYPSAMLRARVISVGVRMVLPGVIVGIYTPEEVEGFDARPDHPPARPRPEPLRRPEPAGPADFPVIGQPDPRGHDPRSYADVVKAAVEATNAAVRAKAEAAGAAPPGEIAAARVHKHLWKVAEKEGFVEGEKPSTLGPAIRAVVEVYRVHRAWVREEIATYLFDLQGEAEEQIVPPEPDGTEPAPLDETAPASEDDGYPDTIE